MWWLFQVRASRRICSFFRASRGPRHQRATTIAGHSHFPGATDPPTGSCLESSLVSMMELLVGLRSTGAPAPGCDGSPATKSTEQNRVLVSGDGASPALAARPPRGVPAPNAAVFVALTRSNSSCSRLQHGNREHSVDPATSTRRTGPQWMRHVEQCIECGARPATWPQRTMFQWSRRREWQPERGARPAPRPRRAVSLLTLQRAQQEPEFGSTRPTSCRLPL
jgi:hypothetical protein